MLFKAPLYLDSPNRKVSAIRRLYAKGLESFKANEGNDSFSVGKKNLRWCEKDTILKSATRNDNFSEPYLRGKEILEMEIKEFKENDNRLYAFYTRISTRFQNLENQSILFESYRQSKGIPWGQIKTYSDIGSGKNGCRNGYEEMIKAVEARLIKEIVSPDLTRLWRDWAQFGGFLKLCEKYNVRLTSLRENLDSTSPMGRALIAVVAILSQMEREILIERTMAGLERAKREGKVLGRPKGRKDRKRRSKAGYYLRYRKQRDVFGNV